MLYLLSMLFTVYLELLLAIIGLSSKTNPLSIGRLHVFLYLMPYPERYNNTTDNEIDKVINTNGGQTNFSLQIGLTALAHFESN